MFKITITRTALDDLRELRKPDQEQIRDAIDSQLPHEPSQETRNRKRLRPNPLADWELRVGTFRVFYHIDEAATEVRIVAIGRKRGNKLFVRGEEHSL
jgi:mRNA-degrading endonuclease RelE of RelBE toxin-antitoxin system